ncbi:DUF1893 domain-containing protein [Chloroflexota bacterium]
MYTPLFDEFLVSGDTLRVYKDSQLLFSSDKDGLLPLLEYIDSFAPYHKQAVIFDKIMGNAAALLSVVASCQKVYSPLGSQLAVTTLDKNDIDYHITEIVPYIQQADREDMCPMEKLSLDKGPEEFYEVVRIVIKQEGRRNQKGR